MSDTEQILLAKLERLSALWEKHVPSCDELWSRGNSAGVQYCGMVLRATIDGIYGTPADREAVAQ